MSAHASGGFRSNQQHRVARATATGEERHYGLLRAPVCCPPHAIGQLSRRVRPYPRAAL